MEEFKKQLKKTAHQLVRKADRMQHKENRQIVFQAALLSVYGWQLTVPVLLGILVGVSLDKMVPVSHFSWTLNFILLGFIVGIYNATQWMKKNLTVKRKENGKH